MSHQEERVSIEQQQVHVLMYTCTCIIWASLSKPHTDRDNSPHAWSNNGIYIQCIYLCIDMYVSNLPHICRTLVPEIHVRQEMLCILVHVN